ncbi:hypothetical protein QQ045_002165 [Rhodiola kirilowii]
MCDTKSSFFLLYSLPYTLGYNSQSTDLQPNQPKHSSLSDDGRSDHPLHGRHPRDDWRLSTILCSEGFCFGIVEFKEASAAHKAIQLFSYSDDAAQSTKSLIGDVVQEAKSQLLKFSAGKMVSLMIIISTSTSRCSLSACAHQRRQAICKAGMADRRRKASCKRSTA